MTPTPGQPIRRRADDDRMDELMGKVGDITAALGVVANDVSYLKVSAERNGHSVGTALEKIAEYAADITASPAGRDAVRRIGAVETEVEDHGGRLTLLENFRIEIQADFRATLRLFRVLATGVSVVATVLAALWTLHLLGVLK